MNDEFPRVDTAHGFIQVGITARVDDFWDTGGSRSAGLKTFDVGSSSWLSARPTKYQQISEAFA